MLEELAVADALDSAALPGGSFNDLAGHDYSSSLMAGWWTLHLNHRI